MRNPSLTALRLRGIAGRRIWALALLAWLGILAQPCMAAQPAGAMSHCQHAGAAQQAGAMDGMPCHTMVAVDCDHDAAATSNGPTQGAAPALPAGCSAAGPARQLPCVDDVAPRGGTGPPAHILFCSLSN